MSTVESVADADFYDFELTYSFDEHRDPSQVTISSQRSDEIFTGWISAPIEISLPVEECV